MQQIGVSRNPTAVEVGIIAESNEFKMPHKSIAAMLGARREGVTEAAGKLQAAGLITYRRARIQILDEAGSKKKSCEC